VKILVVDDDEISRDLLEQLLLAVGHVDITKVNSAEYALCAIRETSHLFDCILLDIQMPVTDGISLCRTIRQMPNYRETPILMMTVMCPSSGFLEPRAA